MPAALVKASNVFVVERIDVEDPGIETPEQRCTLLPERSHGRELRSAKDHKEGGVNPFAVPPCLQDGGQFRSLSNQIRKLVEDQSESARALFPCLGLLRSVAHQGIPRDGNFLGGDTLRRQGRHQLACEREPLRGSRRLLSQKVAVRLFRLISRGACCEVPLQEECLA